MAHFISDRLDYSNTDIFVSPFGGMCRVLLNKPRHKVECYNDYNPALCALMRILSNRDTADEFIHRLYDETEVSRDEFNRQKAIYDNAVTDYEEQEKKKLLRMLIDYKVASAVTAMNLLDVLYVMANEEDEGPQSDLVMKAIDAFNEKCKTDMVFRESFGNIFKRWVRLRKERDKQGFVSWPSDMGYDISDMDLAIATYVVFAQSMNGMGGTWSEQKFKSTDQYQKRVLNLYECAERLEGIQVYQIEAIDFFREMASGGDTSKYGPMNWWVNDPEVMMYCDPSYIKPEDEIRRLKKKNGKEPKNLGKVYARSFGYEDQELFLQCIQNAKCKIMVSNYDLLLYNKYLNEETGWRREEFFTSTSAGGKADSSRTEVIWYNY